MKTKKDQFNVEWQYAKQVWNALVNGEEIPTVPRYSVWEVNDRGEEKLIKQIFIKPMVIRYRGTAYFE